MGVKQHQRVSVAMLLEEAKVPNYQSLDLNQTPVLVGNVEVRDKQHQFRVQGEDIVITVAGKDYKIKIQKRELPQE